MSKSARVTVVMEVSVKDDAIMSSFVQYVKDSLAGIADEYRSYRFLTEFEVKVEQETMHGENRITDTS